MLKNFREDHYGLEKVKERIIEFLAVQKNSKNERSNFMSSWSTRCRKMSLGKSIAKATNRKFKNIFRIRDEVEIRGHRRTYIGSFL